MKTTLTTIGLLLLGIHVTMAQDYTEAIDKARFLIEAHRQQTNIPGCQVAVMVKGQLVWSEGFGVRDLENGLKVTTETKFRVASVSKPITAMALGKLMESHLLDMDKDIRTYLPTFPDKGYTITARHLASSTSGIRHYNASDPEFNTKHYGSVLASLERFENDDILFEPGTQYAYSSYGWVLLSAVMEKASNTSFFTLMENTWDELGMDNTIFDYPDKSVDDTSKFYVYDKKRKLAPTEDRSFMYAGGGYLSTADDLVHMGDVLISDTYLKPETRELLTSSFQLSNGIDTYYGLGWETGTNRLGSQVFFHSGSLPTSVAHLMIYPEEELVFAYVANTGDHVFFNAREAQSIAELFLEEKAFTKTQTQELLGSWHIATTSFRNKDSEGLLRLSLDEDAMISGSMTFKRSKKKITCPIMVSTIQGDQVHMIAVSPMFIDMYVTLTDNDKAFTGHWLHDFNIKGIPEKDPYWAPRKIDGSKINHQ